MAAAPRNTALRLLRSPGGSCLPQLPQEGLLEHSVMLVLDLSWAALPFPCVAAGFIAALLQADLQHFREAAATGGASPVIGRHGCCEVAVHISETCSTDFQRRSVDEELVRPCNQIGEGKVVDGQTNADHGPSHISHLGQGVSSAAYRNHVPRVQGEILNTFPHHRLNAFAAMRARSICQSAGLWAVDVLFRDEHAHLLRACRILWGFLSVCSPSLLPLGLQVACRISHCC